ncbi:TonB-dependent receptor [Thiothrix subterranea]|uniref:TonB-dependent receptor plug domain-containing protein n=1 Tax=Thiothrix subterranea TaxID=2735563 RepID=UPI00192BECC3|nr:TonB-dependent receptor [Thiothrix subterranea]QQZ27292.1 TonB-dependent receptor [Thiothrix subterranea]
MAHTPKLHLLVSLPLILAALDAHADTTVYELGTITVTGKHPQIGEISADQASSEISSKKIKQFNRTNVADALNLLPGVTVASVGARNEKTVYVRGFDMRQVPLFVDGIPLQVPYDGYVDFNRFTTADLSAIQVNKGFSSGSYGPNTLGGAINLISSKPRDKFEGDASAGFAEGGEHSAAVNVGTNQGKWYLQAGASTRESDGFELSSDFKPTTTEDGGLRNNAYRKDNKVSLKVGLTPNDTDEYALSYFTQHGKKGNPPSTIPTSARYWQWPLWDEESLHLITNKALTPTETVKLRLYQDKYENGIDSYTDGTYTTLKKSGAGSVGATGKSRYHDRAEGGSVELESTRFDKHTVRLSAHTKQDKHKADDTATLVEQFEDTTQSLAIDDEIALKPNLTLSLGAARNTMEPDSVYKSTDPVPMPAKQSATNAQVGLFWDVKENSRVYTTIADKTRFPTLKDRYSLRLGTAIPNPDLKAEEARHYEIGYQGKLHDKVKVEAAVFQTDTTNLIQQVNNVSGTKYQMQNVGKVRTTGLETGVRAKLTEQWEAGGQLTLLERKNQSNSNKLTAVPDQKISADLTYRPTPRWETQLVVNHEGSRWDSNTVKLAGFNTADAKVAFRPTKQITLDAGVTNLTDKNYQLTDGFPNPGRMWFTNASYDF